MTQVPGHVGVRNVKWLQRIKPSDEEAHGPWQRGLAYKGFSPGVTSVKGMDVAAIPSVQEMPVTSAIVEPYPNSKVDADGDLTVKGFAWSGGGRGIVRVDVSGDGGATWVAAELTEGKEQDMSKAWAWTFWEAEVPIPKEKAGQAVQMVCKATDAAYNVQPESVAGIWNLRGLNNNAWHRVDVRAMEEDA